MTGSIVQVNISPGGLPKRPVPEGRVTPLGIEGDAWAHPGIHGGVEQALLLIAAEVVDELAGRGFPVFYGALGENLTTRGLDPAGLRPGQQFRAGQALIELTRIRVPCDSLAIYGAGIGREIYDRQTRRGDPASQHWGRSGFYARVLEPGRVRPQDIITLVSMLA